MPFTEKVPDPPEEHICEALSALHSAEERLKQLARTGDPWAVPSLRHVRVAKYSLQSANACRLPQQGAA